MSDFLVGISVRDLEGMRSEIEDLKARLLASEARIKALGYDWVGERLNLVVFQEEATKPFYPLVVEMPTIKMAARYEIQAAEMEMLRGDARAALQRQEAAVEAAVRHTAATWVRLFQEKARGLKR